MRAERRWCASSAPARPGSSSRTCSGRPGSRSSCSSARGARAADADEGRDDRAPDGRAARARTTSPKRSRRAEGRSGCASSGRTGEAYVLDYAALCDGRGHVIIRSTSSSATGASSSCRRAAMCGSASGLRESSSTTTTVVVDGLTRDGAAVTGAARRSRAAMAPRARSRRAWPTSRSSHPFRWLTLIAAVPPASRGTIYGLHRRGFAGQMHRSADHDAVHARGSGDRRARRLAG